MFKTEKTQFAIRKLKKMTAVVLLSFGILGGTTVPSLAASTQESQLTATQETPSENQAPENEVKKEITENKTGEDQVREAKVEQATVPSSQTPETSASSQDSAPEVKQAVATPEQKTDAQPEAAANQPVQPTNSAAPTQLQDNKQTAVSTEANEKEAADKTAATENKVIPSKNTKLASAAKTPTNKEKATASKLTITSDQDLKKFDPYFDASQLDQSHLLGIAGAFHIFGQDVTLNADTNGNIAAGKLEANVDFGTRGDSHNHTQGDIYYIESGTLKQNGFRHDRDYIVLGDGFDLKTENGKVYANGIELTNVKPEEIKKAPGYLDIQAELAKLGQKADDFKKQPATPGVIANFSDMNNQYIDLSGVDPAEKTIFINIPAQLLANPQPITIKGLSPTKDGAALVLNVADANRTEHSINTQIKVIYSNQNQVGAGESHAHPNKLLWNFGTETTAINFNSGYFMGSILATNATITANVNVDGNIIGKKVVINGGESHRWDLNHPLDEVQIPDQPTQPTDPTVPEEPSLPVEPEKPTTPVEPTTPVRPTTPVQVTDPLQPTWPKETEQPSSPSESEEESKQPVTPVENQTPIGPEAEESTPPLAEDSLKAQAELKEEPAEEAVRPLPEKSVKPSGLMQQEKTKTKTQKATKIAKAIPLSKKITASSSFNNRKASSNRVMTANEEALPQASEQKNNPLAALIALAFSAGLLAWGSKKKKN